MSLSSKSLYFTAPLEEIEINTPSKSSPEALSTNVDNSESPTPTYDLNTVSLQFFKFSKYHLK